MRVNEAGLALIRCYEGFRAKAYRCPVGVLTIGYGHTSMAGPPEVRAGMVMSKRQAEEVLSADVAVFASEIARFIRPALTSNQFSALVSFAYNVGVGAFRKSSVLAAVNRNDFDSVPRRLNLWVKAGGRVLSGLVKRRASEGQLFMRAEGVSLAGFDDVMALPTPAEREEMDQARGLLDLPAGKPMANSTTVWASLGQFAATLGALASGAAARFREASWEISDFAWLLPEASATNIIIGFAAVSALVWVIRERKRRAEEDGV